jgi:dCTP deaminase
VKFGVSLVQIRLFKGPPKESRIDGKQLIQTVLVSTTRKDEGELSVDLTPDFVGGNAVCAFSASRERVKGRPLPLWTPPKGREEEKPSPHQFWQFETADSHKRLRIMTDRFYIIRSKELIWLPKGVAVYCRASDESIGEMRIHYAGFVHPFFGTAREDGQRGTPLIFEVRGHDVNVNLTDGEKMARLEFFRMSEDCVPGEVDKEYGSQKLKLSKFFRDWPASGKLDQDRFLLPN